MPDGGLDVEKLSLLGKWAEGLQRDQRAEVAAAGKAILMLIEEVERLHVVIWDGRLNPAREPEPEPEEREPAQENLDDFPSLLHRLRHRFSAGTPG
ncbi:MAG: hypothetical protein QOD43_1702 [Gaiellaceae bacterium]|nr:hypothetical protein [Gaiellaceae bacterium]